MSAPRYTVRAFRGLRQVFAEGTEEPEHLREWAARTFVGARVTVVDEYAHAVVWTNESRASGGRK